MTVTTHPPVSADLNAARDAIANLVDLYFDNVPESEMRRDDLVECLHEGLSDELTRLYRIDAAAEEAGL